MKRQAIWVVVAVLGAGIAGACSSDGGSSNDTTTTTSTPATIGTTTTPAAPLEGAALTPVSTPATGHALHTGLRAENQGGYDRVTFEFQNELPGYGVEYVPRPIQEDASGKTIEVKGDNVLRVHMAGASGVDLSGGKVTNTYGGAKRISPAGTASVQELVEAGDFEGNLTWVAGVHGKPPFKVTADAANHRLYVDIAH